MNVYTLLLHKKKNVSKEQDFISVSFFALTEKHKQKAINRICRDFNLQGYEFLQVSRMRLINFFRFL